jgi:hypothetical protein
VHKARAVACRRANRVGHGLRADPGKVNLVLAGGGVAVPLSTKLKNVFSLSNKLERFSQTLVLFLLVREEPTRVEYLIGHPSVGFLTAHS